MYSGVTGMGMVSDEIECLFIGIIHNEFSFEIGAICRPLKSYVIMFNEKIMLISSDPARSVTCGLDWLILDEYQTRKTWKKVWRNPLGAKTNSIDCRWVNPLLII